MAHIIAHVVAVAVFGFLLVSTALLAHHMLVSDWPRILAALRMEPRPAQPRPRVAPRREARTASTETRKYSQEQLKNKA